MDGGQNIESTGAAPGPKDRGLSRLSYEEEKELGIRRSNGARNLSRLSPRHRRIIQLHLEGYSGKDIAEMMNLRQATVSLTLNDPLAQQVIAAVTRDYQQELVALQGRAVSAVRDALADNPNNRIETRLKGVDRLAKMMEATKTQTASKTAEDVIQEVMGGVTQMLKNSRIEQENKVVGDGS